MVLLLHPGLNRLKAVDQPGLQKEDVRVDVMPPSCPPPITDHMRCTIVSPIVP